MRVTMVADRRHVLDCLTYTILFGDRNESGNFIPSKKKLATGSSHPSLPFDCYGWKALGSIPQSVLGS